MRDKILAVAIVVVLFILSVLLALVVTQLFEFGAVTILVISLFVGILFGLITISVIEKIG